MSLTSTFYRLLHRKAHPPTHHVHTHLYHANMHAHTPQVHTNSYNARHKVSIAIRKSEDSPVAH